ncbi:MAG: phosphate ABC transporter permease PstA [bacterium]|nr:phosphate ABC transporter permease PstA [bacterium]
MSAVNPPVQQTYLPDETAFRRGLSSRHLRGRLWRGFFLLSIVLALFALLALFYNVVNSSAGLIAVQFVIPPEEVIEGGDISSASAEQLAAAIVEYRPNPALVLIRNNISAVPADQFTTAPLSQVLAGRTIPEGAESLTIRELSPEQVAAVMAANISPDVLRGFVDDEIIGLNVLETYTLTNSLLNRAAIEAQIAADIEAGELPENTRLEFRWWLTGAFISSGQSSDPVLAGIRTALIGTVWIVIVTVALAFPIGVGAAIYLEEYSAPQNPFAFRIARLIETNIRNLAGVPSIIYGLLGLAIFVRTFEALTSGAIFGINDSNGRTILSASLTMSLLILPVIIINAQEAIRAVPSSIREASYGLGATKWQTIWKQVLPAAMPGILTGTILGMSRAIGETAPLVVIGASTAIFVDPNGPFSSFTALPIQIYQWTARPQAEFRAIAASAIIVLITLLLLLNASAILLRQYFRRRLQG